MINLLRSFRNVLDAQARFDRESSLSILANRRKMLIVLLLAAPAILVTFCQAADILPEKIPILGGSKAYMPCLTSPQMLWGSILVGFLAGLITGAIGAGGGYILTPALMSFGVRGIMAVGTDQFHLFAKAIMGTTIHRKLGNVNFGLAAWFVIGSAVGVTAGGRISRAIFQQSPALSDAVISTVYVVVLGILGLFALVDWMKLRKGQKSDQFKPETTTSLAVWLQSLKLPPYVKFDEGIVEGGRRISVYPVVFCGLVVGFVASIMGVGGGFLTFPMFVYGLGVSTFTTVGTDILQIIFTAGYSSIFQYAIYGYVFYTLSMGMLVGSLVGVQIGAIVTKMVKGSQIRAFYALTILAGFVNRSCALPRKLADLGYISMGRQTSVQIETIGTVIFFGIVGFFAVWLLSVFFKRLGGIRAAALGPERAGRLLAKPRSFALGVAGLLAFTAFLAVSMMPFRGHNNAMAWADTFFNQLAKSSANYIEEGRKKAEKFKNCEVNYGMMPREFADKDKLARLVEIHGFSMESLNDARIRIKGDLAKLSLEAINEAGLSYDNNAADIEKEYGFKSTEVIYCWWLIFDGLTRRYTQDNMGAEANFTKFVTTKILEPAYNFRGIAAKNIRDSILPVTMLLLAYIAFTLWYGFSMLLIFEGLGITFHGGGKKAEA